MSGVTKMEWGRPIMVKLRSTRFIVCCTIGLMWSNVAGAEPITLAETELDSIAAAGVVSTPELPSGAGGYIGNRNEITTQISMPVSNAIAICFQCSGNASVIAIADALAVSSGEMDIQALANALRPYLKLPPSAPPQPASAKGHGGKR